MHFFVEATLRGATFYYIIKAETPFMAREIVERELHTHGWADREIYAIEVKGSLPEVLFMGSDDEHVSTPEGLEP